MLLKITNGSISFGNVTILEEINFEVHEQDKIALVGRNGCGKTSLLNCLINDSAFEEGIGNIAFQYEKKKNLKFGYLKQNAIQNELHTLNEELNLVFENLIQMEVKLKEYENNMTDYFSYEKLKNEFSLCGGYEYRGNIDKILPKFGFSLQDKAKQIKDFSGGEKTKIALIKLLLSKPDLLLLDEPTNHLDIKTISWLEEYLKNYSAAIVLVSHDRMFLDNIVNKVYEIEYGSIKKYIGNYSSFEKQKDENDEKIKKDYEAQQKEITRLQKIADRFRYKPSKASMAMSKLKQIEHMVKIDCPKEKDMRNPKIDFPLIKESSDLVLSLKNVEIGYDKVLNTISFELHKGERLAILGANGTGKSTLLKTIIGAISKKRGEISFGTQVYYQYFDQQFSFLNENHTILEEFKILLPERSSEEIRRFLGAFLFTGDDVFKPIKVLSGGEKVRLELAKMMMKGSNLLILDEPTNHMDILGKKALENCLKHYKGTILFVSHDRYFVNKIADSLFILENHSQYFRGTYEEYLKSLKAVDPISKNKEIANNHPVKKENTKEKQKEIKKIELEISKIETEITKIEKEMLKEENYLDYKKMKDLADRKSFITLELESLYHTWEEKNRE